MIRSIVRHEMRSRTESMLAVVTEVHVNDGTGDYAADIRRHDGSATWNGVPVATSYIGHIEPLRVDEIVLVQFLGGDEQRPFIIGRLYSDSQRPPEHTNEQSIAQYPYAAGDDERIDVVIDPAGESGRSWSVQLPGDVELSVNDGGCTLRHGELQAQVDGENGQVVLTTGSATCTLGDDGSIRFEADGDLTIQAGGALKLDGANGAELTSSGTVDVKGGTVNIN